MGFSRKSKQAPPEYGHVDSDDDSVPPAPPPPPMMGMGGEDSQSEDHFQDHLDPAGTGVHGIAHGHGHGNNDADEEDKAPVKKWRLLKREAEHVLIPQDEPNEHNNNNSNHMDGNGNGMDMENALDGGSQHLANNPNGNVPMQGHFRGIQSAQDFDEEEAGMDEIEVPSSSVVARMNHKERKHMGQFRNSKYFKLAMLLVLGVVVLEVIMVTVTVIMQMPQMPTSTHLPDDTFNPTITITSPNPQWMRSLYQVRPLQKPWHGSMTMTPMPIMALEKPMIWMRRP